MGTQYQPGRRTDSTDWVGMVESGQPWGAYDEYWHDALGRRILKRSRQESPICTDTNRCYSSIERTVWDGDQVLWEVRQAGSGEEENPSDSPLTGQTGHVGCVYAGGLLEGRQAALNLQPDGSKAKAYQVRQVRRIITEHKLTTDEDE